MIKEKIKTGKPMEGEENLLKMGEIIVCLHIDTDNVIYRKNG